MTLLCSEKLTQAENTIWRRFLAVGARQHPPRRRHVGNCCFPEAIHSCPDNRLLRS